MRTLPLLLFLVFSLALPAQKVEKLWSGTTTLTLSNSGILEEEQRSQRVFYRSPQSDQGSMVDVTDNSVGTLLFRAFTEGRLPGYVDAMLRKKMTKAKIEKVFYSKDTVTLIDPETYESKLRVITRQPDPADYQNVSLNLRLTYFSDGSMQQTPLWVSLSADPKGAAVFFPVEKLTKAISFKGGAWNAVDRMKFSVPLDALETERESQLYKDKIFDQLFMVLKNQLGSGFCDPANWQPLSPSAVDQLINPKDTVSVIDPTTYEVTDKLVEGIPFYEGVGKIRLVQFWAWDDAKARFAFSPIGYAPLEDFLDGKGGSVTRPTFYWVEKGYRK